MKTLQDYIKLAEKSIVDMNGEDMRELRCIVPAMAKALIEAEEALKLSKGRIQYLAAMLSDNRHHDSNERDFLPKINDALSTIQSLQEKKNGR